MNCFGLQKKYRKPYVWKVVNLLKVKLDVQNNNLV